MITKIKRYFAEYNLKFLKSKPVKTGKDLDLIEGLQKYLRTL